MNPGALIRPARGFLRDQPLHWREAGLCAPAIPLILAAGVITHQTAYAAVASGAAFCVGFGAARDFRGWRWAAMIAASLGTTVTAFAGVLAGGAFPLTVVVAAVAAAACALLALVDEDAWWIVLQTVIAFLVASAFAGPPHAALVRAGVVLAGGAAQLALVVVLAHVFPRAAARLPPGPPKPPASRRLFLSHAGRAAICVAVSLVAAHALGLTNGYWAPMTALLVLKPGLSDTNTRGLARLGGTVIGGVGATLFAVACGYWPPLLIAGVGVSAAAAFALQKAHYAVLSSFITATVVLLLSLAEGGGAWVNAEHRLIATLLGGAVALAVARIAPHSPLSPQAVDDRIGGVAA